MWRLAVFTTCVTGCQSEHATPSVAPWEQRIASEELTRAMAQWQPEAGFVVILDLETGAVRAMAGREGAREANDLAARRAWITGSTLKTFTIAAALEAKTITLATIIDCAPRPYAERTLTDWKRFGAITVEDGLVVSSNVCASRVLDSLGLPRWLEAMHRFHLDEPPAPFPRVDDPGGYDAALLAGGELAAATPLQVASAYAAIFHDGLYRDVPAVSPGVAHALVELLESAVIRPDGTGARAAIPGRRVSGKTGTAVLGGDRVYASFVGTVLDGPPLLILVGLVAPRDGTGPTAAAPMFARIAERLVAGSSGIRERSAR